MSCGLQGIGKQAVLRASGEDAYASLMRALSKKLVRLPVIDPAPLQVRNTCILHGLIYMCWL